MATRCRIEAVQQRTSLLFHMSQSSGPKAHSWETSYTAPVNNGHTNKKMPSRKSNVHDVPRKILSNDSPEFRQARKIWTDRRTSSNLSSLEAAGWRHTGLPFNTHPSRALFRESLESQEIMHSNDINAVTETRASDALRDFSGSSFASKFSQSTELLFRANPGKVNRPGATARALESKISSSSFPRSPHHQQSIEENLPRSSELTSKSLSEFDGDASSSSTAGSDYIILDLDMYNGARAWPRSRINITYPGASRGRLPVDPLRPARGSSNLPRSANFAPTG